MECRSRHGTSAVAELGTGPGAAGRARRAAPHTWKLYSSSLWPTQGIWPFVLSPCLRHSVPGLKVTKVGGEAEGGATAVQSPS